MSGYSRQTGAPVMRVSPSSPADIESAPFATESRSDAVANMLDWSSMAAGAYGEKVLASRGGWPVQQSNRVARER